MELNLMNLSDYKLLTAGDEKPKSNKTRIIMKTILFIFFILINTSYLIPSRESVIKKGQQPQLTAGNNGTLRLVYGDGDKIFCATSLDNGLTFPEIKLAGEVKEMALGMSRGPQLASSKNYSLVSAIDEKGLIHIFQLNHKSGKWSGMTIANDVAGSAMEGLMSITADENNNFYAVWLDLRDDGKNKICFAYTIDQGTTWTKNKIIYKSPDKTVCECCKPSIVVCKSKIYIMFRNWLNGSRDLYLMQSDDKGNEFKPPVKLGYGTWKLNGCPMDGGGLVVNQKFIVTSVWQREGKIYLSMPGEEEKMLGTGVNCDITDSENPIITWQEGSMLKLMELSKGKSIDIDKGSFIQAVRTHDNRIVCAWENNGNILFKKL